MSLLINGAFAFARNEADSALLKTLATDHSLGFADIVRALVRYHGSLLDGRMPALGQRLASLRPDLFTSPAHVAELLRTGGFGALDAVREAAGGYTYPAAADESEFQHDELLPTMANLHRSDELPASLSLRLHLPSCPPLSLISAREVSVFCGPWAFHVFSPARGSYARSASTRPLSSAVLEVPRVQVDRPIVIVSDTFHGWNFAHFLFDRCARIFAFAERAGVPARDCLFVMGGFTTEFHRIVMAALCRLLGLDEENFFYPAADCVLRSTTTTSWFSDMLGAGAHPAQMFRPAGTRWMRAIARAVIGEPLRQTRRLYITRRDVKRRMVVNEADYFGLLERHGFDFVNLSNIRIADQIRLMGSASCVVAAHGMGLALMTFNEGTPTLIELHNPRNGIDDYAFMAKGLGFTYQPVLGVPAGEAANFSVAAEQIAPLLPPALAPARRVAERRAAMLDFSPGQRWYPGAHAAGPAADEIAPPLPGLAVMKHVRAPDVADTNAGYWQVGGCHAGGLYTARCFVYLPAESSARHVELAFGVGSHSQAVADMTLRDGWQCLAVTGSSPAGRETANLVLRMRGNAGAICYSAGWAVSGDFSPPDAAAARKPA